MHAMKAYGASKGTYLHTPLTSTLGGRGWWPSQCMGKAPSTHGIAASKNYSHLLTDIENTKSSKMVLLIDQPGYFFTRHISLYTFMPSKVLHWHIWLHLSVVRTPAKTPVSIQKLPVVCLPNTVRFIHMYFVSFNNEFISDVQNRSTLSVKRTLPCINWFLVSLPIKWYVSFTWESLASTVEVARTSWVTTRCSCRVALVVMVVATVFSSTYIPRHHGTAHNVQHVTFYTDNTTQLLVTCGSKWHIIHDFIYWQCDNTVHSVAMTFVKMIKPLQKILHNNYIFHDKFPYRQSPTFVHNSFLNTCMKVEMYVSQVINML